MKEKILSRMNKIVALALLLFGIAAFFTSRHDLKFGSFARPQGGFAPTIFSVGLIIFSVINLVIELFKENKTPEKLAEVDWKKWLYYTLLCGAYVFLIKKIGFAVGHIHLSGDHAEADRTEGICQTSGDFGNFQCTGVGSVYICHECPAAWRSVVLKGGRV